VDIWAEGKHPFNEFCGKLMGLAFKRKDISMILVTSRKKGKI
jgi:hypothetical protein